MRAAHTAGIVAAFIEHEVWFPYVCGLSAGASNTVNYLARDAERTRMCFVDIAGDKRFGGIGSLVRHDGFFNSQWLYDEAILGWDASHRLGDVPHQPNAGAHTVLRARHGPHRHVDKRGHDVPAHDGAPRPRQLHDAVRHESHRGGRPGHA